MSDICFQTATDLAAQIRAGDLSAREVMEAHLMQIERVNPQVNAIPTLLPERALAAADEADATLARGDEVGPLHGLPVAHKDLADVAGVRTTYGSPIFADHVPERSGLIVERLQKGGALTIGKTNTPEFGAGSQTFNPVFGRTLNPYDTSRTCGGSSGGAAVSLATGMTPIADGSDMGGSLRNPAAWNNVVGFRPSPGRVPSWPKPSGWGVLGVEGPMARTVQDIALMMQAIAGPDVRSPIAIREPASLFAQPLARDLKGLKIAWSQNLGDLPIEAVINETINAQQGTFEALGCDVISAEPQLTEANDVFQKLRGWAFATGFAPLIETHRDQLKETVIWNSELGMNLTAMEIAGAQVMQTTLYHRMSAFMEAYDYLICPVTQVSPFDVNQEYVTEINGVKMDTYIDWMKSCYYITVLGFPAISVPCGFTPAGLPVGMQIVGKHQDDFGVLQIAHAFEQATEFWKQRPEIA